MTTPTFNFADSLGIPLRLTRDVTADGQTVPAGTVGNLKWVGADKFKAGRQRLGLALADRAKLLYVGPDAVERVGAFGGAYSDTPPFKVGDRVALRKYAADPTCNGTVFNVSRVTETQWTTRGGKVGRRYGRPVIKAEAGMWRLGVDWDGHPQGKRIHRWVYVKDDSSNVILAATEVKQ